MRREIFIFKWLWNILRGSPCILEGGEQTRDPTYSSDAVDAWLLGVEAEAKKVVGQYFQVSYGGEDSVAHILSECMKACGTSVKVIRTSYRPGEGHEGEFRCVEGQEDSGILTESLAQTRTATDC